MLLVYPAAEESDSPGQDISPPVLYYCVCLLLMIPEVSGLIPEALVRLCAYCQDRTVLAPSAGRHIQ